MIREEDRHLFMEVDSSIKLSSVILSEENKAKIKNIIEESRKAEELASYGLKPSNKILMYGASGTGKTMLCKALSNYLGYTMMYVDITSLSEREVASNIKRVFELAREPGHFLVFFDECDSIAWNRDAMNSDGGDLRRATNTMFQQLDQLQTKNIFVAATNMIYRLDHAFVNRFNPVMEFLKPQITLDECLARFILPKFRVETGVEKELKSVVDKKIREDPRISYRIIQDEIERAMKGSIIKGTNIVKESQIYDVFALRYGMSTEPFKD